MLDYRALHHKHRPNDLTCSLLRNLKLTISSGYKLLQNVVFCKANETSNSSSVNSSSRSEEKAPVGHLRTCI